MHADLEFTGSSEERENLETAGFWQRGGAKILDLMILVPAFLGVALLSRFFSGEMNQNGVSWERISKFGTGMMILAASLPFLYNLIMLGSGGATIGKKVFRIKVVRESGQPLGYGIAFLRCLVEGGCVFASFGFGVILFFTLFLVSSRGDEDRTPTAMLVCLPAILLCVSPYLPALFTSKRRATHDFVIVKTKVIKVR